MLNAARTLIADVLQRLASWIRPRPTVKPQGGGGPGEPDQ